MERNNLVYLTAGIALLTVASPALTRSGPQATYGSFGVDLAARDLKVKPGDDFWAYANGGWDASTPIPADRRSAGVSVKLVDEAEANVRAILDDMVKDPAKFGVSGKQIGNFYAAWMDEAGIEARGTAPLKPYLDRIAAANDPAALQVLFASVGYASPVETGIIPHLADPTRYAAAVGQGRLGMPRDYYLLPSDAYRKAYRAYVEKIQELAGFADASAKADAIVALETRMAKVQWSPQQSRDIAGLNDWQAIAGLKAKAPDFDWTLMLKTTGLDSAPTILMTQSTALTALGKIFAATPVEIWKDYLAFRFVSDHAEHLPKVFDDAKLDFYLRTLAGVQIKPDRRKRGIQKVNAALGEAVGAVYVARHYPSASQKQISELIEDLRGVYLARIEGCAWMDEATRKVALVKLAALESRAGHPDRYIDYSSMTVSRDNPLANAIAALEFQRKLELERFPRPVDRALWSITPQTVNAYYNPLANQITFPAAILQPPYFDPNADPAVNYGAIGAIIGHEMGRGFDDQGSMFGPSGKLENWWTDATRKAFRERTGALVAQFEAFEPMPGAKVNGKLTFTENVDDLSGIEVAYAAFQGYQVRHGKAKAIGGLTGDQRFFLAYAQSWRTKLREDSLRQQLLTDPHSPAKYRVNGIVRNVDAWYKAFNIQPGDKLYLAPEARVKIW